MTIVIALLPDNTHLTELELERVIEPFFVPSATINVMNVAA